MTAVISSLELLSSSLRQELQHKERAKLEQRKVAIEQEVEKAKSALMAAQELKSNFQLEFGAFDLSVIREEYSKKIEECRTTMEALDYDQDTIRQKILQVENDVALNLNEVEKKLNSIISSIERARDRYTKANEEHKKLQHFGLVDPGSMTLEQQVQALQYDIEHLPAEYGRWSIERRTEFFAVLSGRVRMLKDLALLADDGEAHRITSGMFGELQKIRHQHTISWVSTLNKLAYEDWSKYVTEHARILAEIVSREEQRETPKQPVKAEPTPEEAAIARLQESLAYMEDAQVVPFILNWASKWPTIQLSSPEVYDAVECKAQVILNAELPVELQELGKQLAEDPRNDLELVNFYKGKELLIVGGRNSPETLNRLQRTLEADIKWDDGAKIAQLRNRRADYIVLLTAAISHKGTWALEGAQGGEMIYVPNGVGFKSIITALKNYQQVG